MCESSQVVRHRVRVRGSVQAVGFRDACRREADRRGVSGWARNSRDGSVEIVAEGAPDAVDQLVEWAREGPRAAAVEGVDVQDETPRGESGFTIS